MSDFSFYPELFACRDEAIEALAASHFFQFEHFSALDLDHACFGLEVCGIAEKQDAAAILRVVRKTFRDWRYFDCFYRDCERERGWKIIIHRDPEMLDDFSTA